MNLKMDCSVRYHLILIIFCLFYQSKGIKTGQGAVKDDTSQIKSTIDLLKNGEKEMKLSDDYKDIVLVLGNTGSGMSSYTQWIAGDNDKLIAKEVKKGSGEFIIEDNNRIGNSNIDSKTIFPELVIDNKTNTAYYDCPGFSDTRDTINEIAMTYLIKKVIDHAESVKMIFVIGHPSVRKGVERQDFMKLLRHATELVKDVNKFKHSIAIVATKVDNQYVKQGNSFLLIEDNEVIEAIADFLHEVRQDLEIKENDINSSFDKLRFYRNAIKFIDISLRKQAGNYTKIGIFRRPDESGPLSKISSLHEGKKHIERILDETLNFAKKNNNDFGYAIFQNSKIDTNELMHEVNHNIWSSIKNIVMIAQGHYNSLVEQLHTMLMAFMSSIDAVDVDKMEVRIFSEKINSGYTNISYLVKEIRNLSNPEELTTQIVDSFASLDINFPKDNISSLSNQGQYFHLLNVISDNKLSTRPWVELVQGFETYLLDSNMNIQSDTNHISNEINRQINHDLNRLAKSIQEKYLEKIKLLDIQKLPAELSKGRSVISNITEKIRNLTTTKNLYKEILEGVNNLGIHISMEYMHNIANKGGYTEFLQILSNEELSTPSAEWLDSLEDFMQYLSDLEKWYIFLNSLYAKFSEYEIQRDREKYNVLNIEDWGMSNKSQGIELTKNNANDFFNKTADFNIREHGTANNMTLTDLQLAELNHALSLTLRHDVVIHFKAPYITIEGSYVSIELLRFTAILYNNFKNVTDIYKYINVFALDTVFFDADVVITVNDVFPIITVIAPKWEVIGNRRLELRGEKGGVHQQNKAEIGKPGKAGKPGKPGGTFLGIAENFVNGINLTITTVGGMGGPGQDGGNGKNGQWGYYAVEPDGIGCYEESLCEGYPVLNGFYCEKTDCRCDPYYMRDKCLQHYGKPYCKYCHKIYKCTYKLIGSLGKKGDDGENGGRGGKGGNPGNIVLFELNNYSGILMHNKIGNEGENGTGGIGGVGGKNGDSITVKCKKPSFWKLRWYHAWYVQGHYRDNRRNATGENGTDGGNDKDMQDPDKADVNLEVADVINEYKNLVRENLNTDYRKHSLRKFLVSLDGSKILKNVYTTIGLVSEMGGLENDYEKLNKEDLLFSYKSLLNRISEYAQSLKYVKNSEEKKVLSYVYTAALSRIYNLKDNSESNLIIDISGYLDLVKQDVDALKDLKKQNNKADTIKKNKENYKSYMHKKIEEADNFIKKQIMPEMDNISREMDDKIDLLIKETIKLEEEEKTGIEKLKKKELENTLQFGGLFSYINVIRQVINFLGPVGEVVNAVLGAVSTVPKSLVLDEAETQTFELPPAITFTLNLLIDQMENTKKKKIADLNELLEEIYQETDKYSETFGDTSTKIDSIRTKLGKTCKDKFDFNKIQSLEDELIQELSRKETELKAQKDITNEETADAIAVIEKFQKALQIGYEIYSKYKDHKKKVDAMNNVIEKAGNKLKELKQYKETIYSIIAPMLTNMVDNLRDVASKLNTKSKVSLDITEWNVQGILKDIKLQMQQLTKGFKVENSLLLCIEKLEEAMTTLINVYDRIQNYQEQKNLADYIADISSPAASFITINDSRLNNAVNNLEIIIRSNLVLKQYKIAMNAFEQWVFPFAHLYTSELLLPSHLESEHNIENLVDKAVAQIELLKSKVDVYKTSVMGKYDKYILSGEFNSQYVSSNPFYVWTNQQHKTAISKLLSGQEVVFKSDIMKSAPDKEAVKFSFVELYFKSQNETVQSKINDTLKGFYIHATHLGNSYYRYDDKIHVITSDSQTIFYSFEKNAVGEPVRKNFVYKKIKAGDLMLSPYAVWEIKLINITSKITFDQLKIFENEINIELSGHGSYVNRGVSVHSLADDM